MSSLDQDQLLRLPMQAESRSLNLANTVSIALYEAWRQMDFTGGQ
jgi:tRNA (cytidine/uridine-2'-O-)-methyltransferase